VFRRNAGFLSPDREENARLALDGKSAHKKSWLGIAHEGWRNVQSARLSADQSGVGVSQKGPSSIISNSPIPVCTPSLAAVRLSVTLEDGSELATRILHTRDLFGESVLAGAATHESAVVTERTKAMFWSVVELEQQILRDPRLGLALMQYVLRRSESWRVASTTRPCTRLRSGSRWLSCTSPSYLPRPDRRAGCA
jgi:hypothetical protein